MIRSIGRELWFYVKGVGCAFYYTVFPRKYYERKYPNLRKDRKK